MRRYCFASVNVDASEVDADDVGDANAGNASVALPPLPREVRSKIGRDCISNVIMQCNFITRVMIFSCVWMRLMLMKILYEAKFTSHHLFQSPLS